MNWTVAGDAQLARYFEQENVWSRKWEPVTGPCATVLDHRNEQLNLPVWEATINGKRKRFAANEVSNGVWLFALPSGEGS